MTRPDVRLLDKKLKLITIAIKSIEGSMPVKIKNVAPHTGISSAIVSRALAAKSHVSEKTRRSVLKAIATPGYRPSCVTSSLQVQHSRTIGLTFRILSSSPSYAPLRTWRTSASQRTASNGAQSTYRSDGSIAARTRARQEVVLKPGLII